MIEPEYIKDALDRFGIRNVSKQADLASIIPAVAAPALGAYLGQRWGGGSDFGRLVGGVTGGIAGQYVREELPRWRETLAPTPQRSYQMDTTSQDLPAWAVQGAQFMQPAMKTSGLGDWILGEVPGASPVQRGYEGYKQKGLAHGLAQGGKAFLGMAGGGVPGALLGTGLGMGIEHLTGHPGGLNVPLVNIKLHELLAGLGGTIGATKGLQYATGQGH